MCNIPLQFKIFTIEVYPDGKTCLPAFITPEGQQLSISELTKCRDLIELIIANPDNFHVVKADALPEVSIPKSWLPGPACKVCNKELTCDSLTERQNLLCFDCERKQILDKVNKPEQKQAYIYPEKLPHVSLIDEMRPEDAYADEACIAHGICTHKHCGNTVEKGLTKCFLHKNKDV